MREASILGTAPVLSETVDGIERIVNLSAGPSPMFTEVLRRAQKDMLNWNGKGISVMEMGYRT